MSAWLALTWRAQLAPGETVLVLGATGVAGQLAVQLAKHLGAGRVLAAGRDQQLLATLPDLGADTTVSLDVTDQDLPAALAAAVADNPLDVVIDYLWGRPTEALIAAISRRGLAHAAPRVRLVEVGDSAGPTITLPAQVLRSSGLELCGSGAGTIPLDAVMAAPVHRPRGQRRTPDRRRAGPPRRGHRRLAARSARPPAGPPPLGQMLMTPAGWSAVERCQDLVGVVDPSNGWQRWFQRVPRHRDHTAPGQRFPERSTQPVNVACWHQAAYVSPKREPHCIPHMHLNNGLPPSHP
jgi:Zinc-binding dehydrogenase